MGILDCASGASVWRGYDYYETNRVLHVEEIRAHVYAAAVQGTQKEPYSVEMDLDHPRKSTCSCPYAKGKQIVCKHIVATYFAVFPEAAEEYEEDCDDDSEEDWDDDSDEALYDAVYRRVLSMEQIELQHTLLHLLFNGPSRQLARFIRENRLEDEG